MQAAVDANALRHVIKALTCLAKYGEDVVMYTTAESLTFSTTNTTASAYCRFTYTRPFFTRFRSEVPREGNALGQQGQVNVKSLLAILKHRTVEKTVEKCELSILDGGEQEQGTAVDDDGHGGGSSHDDRNDSLESKLIVRLHCKHGVVKTHRLLLHSTDLVTPSLLDSPDESHLTIAPKALRDLIDHFPFPKGPKYDPKLIWKFDEDEVFLRGQEASLESEAKGLATELSISATEFEVYDICDPPLTICFHIKEFQSTLWLAEHLGLDLHIRFLDPLSPIYITLDGDLADTLFVISTTQIIDSSAPSSSHASNKKPQPVVPRKRPIDDDSLYRIRGESVAAGGNAGSRASSVRPSKRPMKAVVRSTDRAASALARELDGGADGGGSMPPPSIIPPSSHPVLPPSPTPRSRPSGQDSPEKGKQRENDREPLFLPGTQLSQAIRDSGLGIEDMNVAEFQEMMEGDGVEVGHGGEDPDVDMEQEVDELAGDDADMNGNEPEEGKRESSFDLYYDETETQFGPTQAQTSSAPSKAFRPLFDD